MHTNVHLSIYKPFPHPSCLVEHLEFVNYKLQTAETHLKIHHGFSQTPSPNYKVMLHKSLQHKPDILKSHYNLLNTKTDVRRNALAAKNKINLPVNKIKQKHNILKQNKENTQMHSMSKHKQKKREKQTNQQPDKSQYIFKMQECQKQNKKLSDLILRLREQHHDQIESLTEQICLYERELESLKLKESRMVLRESVVNNSQISNILSDELEEARGLLTAEKEKGNFQRKENHKLKKKIFQYQSKNIDYLNQIEQLKNIIELERNVNSQMQSKNNELEQYLTVTLAQLEEVKVQFGKFKSTLKPLHTQSMNICETVLEISEAIDKLKISDSRLTLIKSQLSCEKSGIVDALQKLQQLCDYKTSTRRCILRHKINPKEQEKSFNDSCKILKTCADEETSYSCDSSLYQMILCQAMVIEQQL